MNNNKDEAKIAFIQKELTSDELKEFKILLKRVDKTSSIAENNKSANKLVSSNVSDEFSDSLDNDIDDINDEIKINKVNCMNIDSSLYFEKK